MSPKRILAALFLSQIFVAAAFAQSAETTLEFGRASAGLLDVTPKYSAPLSGSLAVSSSRSQHPLGLGGTFGGTLVKDRVWFFASAERTESVLSAIGPTRATDAKMLAQLGDRQNLAGSFVAARSSAVAAPLTIPSSFLSLHYTGIVSSNMFFTADVSKLRR